MMNEDTDFGRDLIASLQEAAAILRGDQEPARVHHAPGIFDVRALREQMGLSRMQFGERFGLAEKDLRDWESGLRQPDPVSRVLLLVIARSPDAVAEAVAEAHAA